MKDMQAILHVEKFLCNLLHAFFGFELLIFLSEYGAALNEISSVARKLSSERSTRSDRTQSGLYGNKRWLEAWNLEFRKSMDTTIYVAKKKPLISCAVIAQLICAFVFAYATSSFFLTRRR